MVIQNDSNSMMAFDGPSIDFRQYLALLRRWWWAIALSAILAGLAAYLYSMRQLPVYESSTTIMIDNASDYDTSDYSTLITDERLAQTYAQIMTTRPVMEKVVERLDLHQIPAESLAGYITVSPVQDTQLLVVTVRSDDPELSASVANAVVLVFSEQLQDTQSSRFASSQENLKKQMLDTEMQVMQLRTAIGNAKDEIEKNRLQTRLNQYEQIYADLLVSYEQVRMVETQSSSSFVQVEQAVPASKPVNASKMRNTLLAALTGMLLAAGSILAYDMLDDRVKRPEDIHKALLVPVLGTIGHFEEPGGGSPITQAAPRSPTAELFRVLRTNVRYTSVDKPVHTLLITSPTPSDGKTTVATNLAVVMAQSARRVTIMDADLHRPRVHHAFNLENAAGLSSLFVRPRAHLNGEYQQTSIPSLHVVSAGKLPPNPSELLGSNKMREILNVTLRDEDLVILDSPPILSVTDAVVLAPIVDAVLLVVRLGQTRMSALKHAVDQLRYVGANLVGVVINDIDGKSLRYRYYYQNHYYRPDKANGKIGKIPANQKTRQETIMP